MLPALRWLGANMVAGSGGGVDGVGVVLGWVFGGMVRVT